MIVQITTGLSTTVKSAQSKKCRLLAKVRDGLNPKIAKAIRNADNLLGTVMSEADIDNAAAGLKPARGRSGGISIEVEI